MKRCVAMCGVSALVAASLVSAGPPNAELSFDEAYYLHVPMVDVPGAPGAFQNAVFEKHPTSPYWHLLSVARPTPLPGYSIDDVEVVATDELPAQVFLKASGSIWVCSEIGNVGVTLDANHFSVNVYYKPEPPLGPGEEPRVCPAINVPFSKVVPLPVYGLDAGNYSYLVNGTHEGEFELEQNNVLPD